ncbi:MAG: SpvB/TcaC N-terminal domain-containing protein [Xenococcus sp. MO_188.B8]|nr:SpvB/TcaC N-terminal domain-containing protein [Xenococcus sp. MO_188.B8]
MQADKQIQNQITATQISLPKGGGAIQGIGETFQANEFTGTASLSIPIKTSSCRGFEPTLSVDYSSGSGNGSFGLGFNLSIPNIARKTSKGLPKYDRSDTFLIFNGDDLVPFPEGSREEIANNINYTVTSYRPRTEGLFAKIEHWVAENSNSFWKMLSRDNVTSIFGKTENSRIFDPENPSHIFEWLLSETFNTKGDRVVYEYKSENTDNVPDALHEENRTQTANKYIEKIKYGNVKPFHPLQREPEEIDQWHFEVVFDYGEYNLDANDSTLNTPVRAWTNRQDSFSTYQAGFEIRTHRLCRSILMFHRFEAEFGRSEPVLVNATRFSYDETPIVTQLIGVEHIGYSYENGQYKKKQLPPLEFEYTEFQPTNHSFEPLLPEKGEFLPGLDLPPYYSLVDLYGEGIPGILYSDGQTTLYWEAEVKPNSENKTNISYGTPRTIQAFPVDRNVQGATQQLMDLTGNGQLELVVSRGRTNGYYEANSDRSWQNFQTFPSFPTDFSHPDNQLLDATGDGLTDILRMDGDRIWIYPGQGKEGFGKPVSRNREKNIPLPRKGSEEEIWQFTDIFGTGMQHLVRVTNGLVECWPHLGYGKFGKRVLLDNAPRFGARLDASRLFLADIDGSGTTDLIYVHPDRVEIWFNQSGNAFSEPITIPLQGGVRGGFPSKWDRLNQIRFADVYGNGTNCLVFSDNHIKPQHWCYDFCQRRKPYLLNEINNNLGAKSTITYCSSTKFYLEDKKKGNPWIVNLPFPVQVVEKTESFDLISGSKMVSSYVYHHGYYDGVEREFRGFGLVERRDAETLEDLLKSDPPQPPFLRGEKEEAKDFYVPPILTKTWYHTGAWQRYGSLSRQYEQEYFQQDSQAHQFPDSIFADLNEEADAETSRQAHWTLKGMVLRQEVYGLDGSPLEDKPYAITETNYRVKLLQAKGDNKYGVYFVEPRETLSYQYERNPQDPRISHQFVLKVDEYGNVIRSCAVAYGRRPTPSPSQPQPLGEGEPNPPLTPPRRGIPEQLSLKVVSEENRFINTRGEDINLLGIPLENKSYEITNLTLSEDRQYFSFAEINDYLEQVLNSSESNLLSWQRHYYWSPEHRISLPLGEVSPEALLDRTEMAEFSRERVQQAFSSALNQERLEVLLSTEGGYQLEDNYWWNPGLRQTYNSADQFFLPKAAIDPFDNATTYEYDLYHLLPVKVTDALNNEMVVEAIDYQTLQPQRIRDINQNISEVLFDPMGMVTVTSFYGTENGRRKGFAALEEYQSQEQPNLDQLIANPQDYLQGAASYFYYDLFAWKDRQVPVHGVNLIAEDYPNNARILTQISYSDGFGRELQSKMKVEAGIAFSIIDQPSSSQSSEGINPPLTPPRRGIAEERWLTSGRTVYNNKGNPVKQYEPYYLNTYEYVDNETLNRFGVSPTLYYDPLERVIRVETAKGFFSKVEFTPWEQKNYDENDTVKDSSFYKKFLANYPDEPTEAQRNEKDALDKAAVFYDTPVNKVLDSLGNAFLVNDNGLTSYYKYDIQGRLIESIDPRLYASNLAEGTAYYNFKYQYGLRVGSEDEPVNPLVTDSADGGVNLSLDNALGNNLWNRSPRNFDQVIYYDELQRKVRVRTKGIKNDGTVVTDNVVETFIYGESQPNAADYNLRGQLYQLRDQSGIITNSKYNLQGNLLETTRQLTQNYKDYINWDDTVELETESYTSKFAFNAIQQLIIETTPDDSVKTNNYNRLGLLERITVTFPDGAEQPIINYIEYNAKGQRVSIDYANGVKTTYSYEDTTWRLIKLHSTRSNQNIQGNSRQSVIQNIFYTYDPVGNITRLKDNTHATVFHNNQIVEPLSDYTYDALSRLIKANGRKHRGINATTYKNKSEDENFKQSKFIPLSNSDALENYQESYTYDDAGNLIKTTHTASNSWTRTQEIMPDSNRLKTVSSNNGFTDSLPITYDRSGNQQQLNGNSTVKLTFNCCENLVQARIIERPDLPDDSDYYTYDVDEMRTRKVSERLVNGGAVMEKESKIYLGNYEVKRLQQNETTILKRQTLRVMDDETCVAVFHYWEQPTPNPSEEGNLTRRGNSEQVGTRKLRYQLDNHLGSVSLEVDDDAQIISYEEYFPYGGTAFIAGKSQKEVKLKEYRYSGKERDDATGLYYYGARYYAPWLGRWLKPDPAGTVDGLNLYEFVGGNPVTYVDMEGTRRRSRAERAEQDSDLIVTVQNYQGVGQGNSNKRRRLTHGQKKGQVHVGLEVNRNLTIPESLKQEGYELISSTGKSKLSQSMNYLVPQGSQVVKDLKPPKAVLDILKKKGFINKVVSTIAGIYSSASKRQSQRKPVKVPNKKVNQYFIHAKSGQSQKGINALVAMAYALESKKPNEPFFLAGDLNQDPKKVQARLDEIVNQDPSLPKLRVVEPPNATHVTKSTGKESTLDFAITNISDADIGVKSTKPGHTGKTPDHGRLTLNISSKQQLALT